MDLFDHAERQDVTRRPLADAVRPRSLSDYFGQHHVVGDASFLRRAIENDRLGSMILWGPPGSGKTTLAQVIAQATERWFEPFSAVLGGVKEIRAIVQAARDRRRLHRQQTMLFIDEIHRFNKAQQDALLPHIEDGTVTLVGATTENPSFEVNSAILSRCRVVVLKPLEAKDLIALLKRAFEHPVRQQRWPDAQLDLSGLETIAEGSDGDARRALNLLETVLDDERGLSPETVTDIMGRRILNYDKNGDGHYAVISAFIKAMRATDPDAAAYWLERLIQAGEDPLFVLRRMVIFASEDIGHADPSALQLAVATTEAFRLIGMPEGMYPLMQLATYLATAPKSNTVLKTIHAARAAVEAHGNLPVPPHIKNGHTRLGRSLGDGAGYRYPHDDPHHYNGQRAMPEGLEGLILFDPGDQGMEYQFRERLKALRSLEDVDHDA